MKISKLNIGLSGVRSRVEVVVVTRLIRIRNRGNFICYAATGVGSGREDF